ncbi:mitochondrial processing peptidase alpha subunit [Aspergillus arachidicola]|uniref:Mitochondrial-processing peptidase subunit alpha n=2 Tax=Aspergillus arachidicola TaxID=656916 RepID=A0A2G7FKL0_9EURO|nr:mitochondrial processing peptidase alpha subunit [Aspergillus arachidicola]
MRRSVLRAVESAKPLARAPRSVSRSFATVNEAGSKDPVELDQITTLPNGIRVATESLPGPFSGVGVYVDAGSRYEDESLRGVSHIMDRLAFKSTKKRSSDEMLEVLEGLGGNIQCASSRESLMYQSASFNSAVPTTLGLLAETIRDPLITEEEVLQQLGTAEYEIGEIWAKPELILPELVHMAAYKDNTLGNPLLCPEERLGEINKAVVDKYREVFFNPDRMVVAFAGVPHDVAVKLTEQYFGDMQGQKSNNGPVLSGTGIETTLSNSQSAVEEGQVPTIPQFTPSSTTSTTPASPKSESSLLSKLPFLKNLSGSQKGSVSPLDPSLVEPSTFNLTRPSHYTGGFLSLPPIPPPANPMLPRLSHIHLAFEALPISNPDIYALATLQTLLGGGGSFSAGGPGKGMYSRLYTNVLNQHGWVESCIAFNHSYTDSGIFGISASCSPTRTPEMLEVMCRELQALTLDNGYSALQAQEVNRAKNQLRSSLLMNLESRMVELEDLGRQVQVHGRKVGVKEMCDHIDALTVEDLRRVARQVFGGNVQNKGQGTVNMVQLQEVEDEHYAQEKPQVTKNNVLLASDDEDDDYTDTESEISEDSDIELDGETFYERLSALKDMIPPSARRQVNSTVSSITSFTKSSLMFSGRALWVISTSAFLVGIPFALAYAEEEQYVQMEREQGMIKGANEMLTPGAISEEQKQAQPSL